MSDERPRYYDREGKPMTWQAWGEVFQDMDYRRICWTAISDEIHVSTVWLGLDHAFGDVDLGGEDVVCHGISIVEFAGVPI